MRFCLCGNKKSFEQCCKPLLKGGVKAKTVRQLMRSRYSAYALGGCSDYLVRTWHPVSAENIRVADLDAAETQWLGLKILSYEQKGGVGQVEFKASYRGKGDDDQKTHHEVSLFHRLNGEWLYVEGKILEQ